MKTIIDALKQDAQVSDYKISITKKESFELFFVKGKLETVRATDTCDRKVTVYVDHDRFRGDSTFLVYPSTTQNQLEEKIGTAVANARLINNEPYTLPGAETGEYTLSSNFADEPMESLAQRISDAVFGANTIAGGSLNAVEVFLNHYTSEIRNSRGLHKVQHRYGAMVEAIPTFNGDRESVELYEQYNFSALDMDALTAEISGRMAEVKARYEAVKPDFSLNCPVVFNTLELADLFDSIASDLNYATVYSHSNLYHKGDKIQKNLAGDPITITMKGAAEGNISSRSFDEDGMSLGEITLVRDGVAENYYGANRFGQYLGEKPTGNLGCLCVAPGTADMAQLKGRPYLEVISMSGLQVDAFNDYIGGEIRLAYYHDGEKQLPVTGISVAGKLQQVLDCIRLTSETAVHDSYMGPAKAIVDNMQIF